MNCSDVRRDMTDLFDARPQGAREAQLRLHLDRCPACRAEYEEAARILASLEPAGPQRASAGFKEGVMNRLTHEIEAAQTAAKPRRTTWSAALRFAVAGAVALAIILGLPYLGRIGNRGAPAPVTALLAQSIDSLAGLQSVHISARMRTLPGDNFDGIGLEYDLVPVEIWRDFSNPPKWRFEKPGRVAVMDGSSYLMLINGQTAVRGTPGAGFVEWLKPLLEPQKVLENELTVARSERVAAGLSQDRGTLVLRMAPKAKGDFTNAWTRNKSIPESDHVRVYRFDPATKRLSGLQVSIGETVVFETVSIVYNAALDPALFQMELPANVRFHVPVEELPQAGPLPASPRETAVAFFEAMAAKDWQKLGAVGSPSDKAKAEYGGLTVISIGEPFQSGLYRGWFVPYEVRVPSGRHRKHNLAVRNDDNRAGRWHVDGGY